MNDLNGLNDLDAGRNSFGAPAEGASDGGFSPMGTPASYWLRHWNGSLPLGISFWINGNLLSAAAVALVMGLASSDLAAEMPRWFSAAGVVYWLALLLLTVWQLVGIWRSAANHISAGHARRWARLAQAMVIFGIITSSTSLATIGVPQAFEFAQLALGRDPVGAYELRILRGSAEIVISGAIVFGLTDELADALATRPGVQVIHLNSHGGRVVEARKLRDLIAARELTTYTETGCFSACTLAYAAGKQRLIGINASLGFHQYSFPGVQQSAFRRQYEKDKSDWLARGIDPRFVERAYATPHHDLWEPEHRELFASGFVTGYAPGTRADAVTRLGLRIPGSDRLSIP
jgi:hypothetical protein